MDFLQDDDISEEEISEEDVDEDKDSKKSNNESRTINKISTEVDASMSNAPRYSNETHTQENEEIVETVEETENNDLGLINRQPLSKLAETYELENFEKRLLLIFNHVNVAGYDLPRIGTDKDVLALTNTFENLGFTVTEKTDLTKGQIIAELNKLTETDFTDYGCVAVAVLTHGSEDGELKAKDMFYSENEIIKRLKLDRNRSLLTKPRIVLIQACRGNDDLGGVNVNQPQAKVVFQDSTENDQFYSLPLESDMLVMHSSYAGKASHRTIEGSWFIQTLCNKIDEFAHIADFESILVKVRNSVAIEHADDKYNKKKQMMETNKQMPVTSSTFTRKLYFRKYQ